MTNDEAAWAYAQQWFKWCWSRAGYRKRDPSLIADLQQELWLALYRSFHSYKPELGHPSTYAYYALRRFRMTAAFGRMNSHMRNVAPRILDARRHLENNGETATLERVCEISGVAEAAVRYVLFDDWFAEIPVEAEDPDEASQERVDDALWFDPRQEFDDRLTGQQLFMLCDSYLTRQEKQALYPRIKTDASLTEVGDTMFLSRERVRQLERQALTSVRRALQEEEAEARQICLDTTRRRT